MNDSKLGYRVTEAAEALTIAVSTLKQEMYQGRIKYIKIGRRVVIPRWALEERLREELAQPVNEGGPAAREGVSKW